MLPKCVDIVFDSYLYMLCVIVICHMYTGLEISHHSTCRCPRIQRCQTIGRHNDGDGVTHVSLEVSRARIHSSDVIMGPPDGIKKSPALRVFTQPFIQSQIKGNVKAPRHWPLWGEFTGDRWIPRTKGQWRGKIFPFDDVIVISDFLSVT